MKLEKGLKQKREKRIKAFLIIGELNSSAGEAIIKRLFIKPL